MHENFPHIDRHRGALIALVGVAGGLVGAAYISALHALESFYPELALAGVPTDAMEAEHDEVHAVLRTAAQAPDVDRAALETALRRLEGHIHREEYDLFPAAHQVLDDAAWDRIHLELEAST